MHSTVYYVGAFVLSVTLLQASGLDTMVGLYGETIEVACNKGVAPPANLFVKWKYDKDDGTSGDLLVKKKDSTSILAADDYANRVNITDRYSLLIAQANLGDQKTFTCMVVTESDVLTSRVNLLVHKKPSPPTITEKAEDLENGKLTTLGKCVAKDANPAANVSWTRNGQPLADDGKTVIITPVTEVDQETGLSTTTSTLQYTASRDDMAAKFACSAQHSLGPDQETAPMSFSIHYPTEKVSLQVNTQGPLKEGDNVTLKCKGDGNPPPTSYDFYIKGQKVTVDSDTHTLVGVTRDDTGEYKCSLVGNTEVVASENITVNFLDAGLSLSGTVVRKVGENVTVKVQKSASGNVKVSWTKDNEKLEKLPKFDKLKYADSGKYECEFSMAGLTQRHSFTLVVEGMPVIKSLNKVRGNDGKHKVLICEVEGSPKPNVLWSINGTSEESAYVDGKITHKIVMVPTANLTVSCTVFNDLGQDVRAINVSSYQTDDSGDQAKLIVGIVVGLLLAALVVGLVYWIYMKKSKQGMWKTGEEAGTSEESKKLEENNHKAEA
ncbi:CD166 antigen homolog isoform X2 [Conger conger]|uniref:CD166 antigen homolog isoform X2 n=1 Tax=Conger conger TaxID=82655 RepID=UPI002A59F2AD|nr:CD166 antigen homolog isoform X2 [Conger conger]